MTDLHDWGTGQAPNPRSYPMSYPLDHRPKWHMFPKTLDDLLQRAGPYADATRTHIEWGAVTVWLMKTYCSEALEIAGLPIRVASLAVLLTREAEEDAAGWPRLSGKIVTPAIYGYSPDSQCEARRSAAQARSLWEAAGRPHIDANRCKFAFQYLVACIRKGLIPPQRTIGDVPPHETL